MLEPFTDDEAFADADTESFQVLVQGEFIERHGLHEHVRCGVRQMDEVEISLQDTVLTRSAMYGDVGEIRPDTLAAFHEAEIVAVHVRTAPAFQMSLPCHTFDFNDINFISFLVEKGIDTFGAPKGNVVFGGIPSGYNRDCFFHFLLIL